MSFAQLDILPSELILNSMFTFNDLNDQAFNDQFALLGYESSNGAKNMGSALLYLVFNCFLGLLIGTISLAQRVLHRNGVPRGFKNERIQRLYQSLKEKVLWNMFIRLIIQQFISLVLSAAINFNQVRFIT